MSGRLLVAALALTWVACADPAPEIDLSGMEPAVRDAIESRRAAVNASPKGPTWGGLGDVLLAHGLEREAAAAYARAAALSDEPFDWLYLQALATEQDPARAEQALSLFRRAAAAHGNDPLVELRIALLLQSLGRHGESVIAFQQALAHDETLQRAHRGLGQELLALGRTEAAIESLERAVALSAADAAGWSALAQGYAAAGREDEARAAARQAQRGQDIPGFGDPIRQEHVLRAGVSSSRRFQRALQALADGDTAEARRQVSAILELRQDNADAHYLMGLIETRSGDLAKAERRFAQALESEPRHARSLLELARLRHFASDVDGVVRLLERLIEVQPEDVSTQLDLGDLYLHLGRWTDAEARFREAIRLDPDLAEAHDRLRLALEHRTS